MPIVRAGRRDGRVVLIYTLLLGVFLFIPWLVEAQQQQRQGRSQDALLPPEKAVSKLEATRLDAEPHPELLETPRMSQLSKSTSTLITNKNDSNNKNDASAIATLAPVAPTVRAPGLPGQKSSTPTAGLSTPQNARSLQDWEVEDFVLLATVDGKLYARDRKTGQERWSVEAEKPMVETIYYRRNRSTTEADYQGYDDYLWIVEPSRDGSLFLYNPKAPDPKPVNMKLTMKRLVEELSPYSDDTTPLLYTGEKRTTMVTLNARTGKVMKWFGSERAMVTEESCYKPNGLLDSESESDECRGTLTIGRTEYTVSIHDKENGHVVATLKYAEWGPNAFDFDLEQQYRTTLDSNYIYSTHDGSVFAVDYSISSDSAGTKFRQKFSSPVVRVFDVARPWGTDDNDPDLVILPQPQIRPPFDEEDIRPEDRKKRIFLNHTEDGSWYAMSGDTYPMAVTELARAQGSDSEWWSQAPMDLSERELAKALVGVHSLEAIQKPLKPLTIGGRLGSPDPGDDATEDVVLYDPEVSLVTPIVRSFYMTFLSAPSELLTKVITILVIIVGVTYFARHQHPLLKRELPAHRPTLSAVPDEGPKATPELDEVPEAISEQGKDVPPQVVTIEATPGHAIDSIAPREQINPQLKPTDPGGKSPETATLTPSGIEPPGSTPKKKAHRGRRGGTKHKRGGKGGSEDSEKPKAQPQPSVEDAVREAMAMTLPAAAPEREPDVKTVDNGVDEVSGPILQMGSLICNTDKLIGTGSNGTLVFEGEFDGRPVAVKRMLIQFFEIASQETKLLRESDDHPNVIRYFAQQSRGGFLYIALELCPASLADVIEKPSLHSELAHAGEKDLPAVLYQITNGLQHLHSLRIVHRDLKPQNILVAKGKDSKPRLLVSDFGLCKKLEGEQSSFRATTAHAAGTSGWRAPELLLDDDNNQTPALDTSTHSGSGPLVNGGSLPPRRATRAIDIFSLGLVFFYVLTKGSHPFDCGGRYLREVNIRKNNFNLDPLDVLGDYSEEAKDLIGSMLEPEPKRRPVARQVMAHPFFWSAKKRLNFLCDVSDHFEKEPRDPPSDSLAELEKYAKAVCGGDFLKPLPKEFIDSMGKQRKYTGSRLLDLLRALRNKKNHYEDMPEQLKRQVGPLPEGYLSFWTRKFPKLLITCWNIVYEVQWDETDRFRDYYEPAGL